MLDISRLATGGIDLILTDLGLPDSQGLASFRELHQAAPDLAIIVLTASDDQEMAVAAADLPNEGVPRRQELGNLHSKLFAPPSDKRLVRGRFDQSQDTESPSLPASMATISRLMSVGLTPLMRLACPNVTGLIAESFNALSRLSPGMER